MKVGHRNSGPSWLRRDGGWTRSEWWLCGALVVAVLLVEVWQTSRMAQLCLRLDQTRTTSQRTGARLEFLRAALDHRATRQELRPYARTMGIVPAEPAQVVALPSAYLAEDTPAPRSPESTPLLALAERVSGALVPEATARGRVNR